MAFFRGTGNTSQKNDSDFIVKAGAKHWRYSLRKEGATEIRVVPAVDENGRIEQLIDVNRGGDQYTQLTNAIAFFDVVTFLGPNMVSMVCPVVEGENTGPVQTFINTIQNAVKNDPKGCDDNWLSWCGMGPNRKDVMSRPSNVMMVQGYLYKQKGEVQMDKEGRPSPRYPVVLQISRSATNELCDKLSKPLDPNAPWSSVNNQLGDFVDPQNGRILVFTPYQHNHNNNIQTWYHADLGQQAIPLNMDDIMSVWRPWDEVIDWNPSLPEVGARLAKAFNASSVVKVFENHPTYVQCITDSIRSIAEREQAAAANRVQTGYTGYAQPYTAYPPQPQYQQPPLQQAQPTVQQSAPPPYPPQPQYAPPQTSPAAPPPYPAGAPMNDGEEDDVAALPFDQQRQQNVTFTPRRPRR